jgi:hypothetical protein
MPISLEPMKKANTEQNTEREPLVTILPDVRLEP